MSPSKFAHSTGVSDDWLDDDIVRPGDVDWHPDPSRGSAAGATDACFAVGERVPACCCTSARSRLLAHQPTTIPAASVMAI
mmetsp:Transcript_8897/g.23608  ORF Transcript_8897/g.23608 Transcript_8897/m.23608 type:complete len:81 (-) Transcript_8897:784-1026(-)|eukprot:1796869-Prymnesium_polylepis.1